MKTTYITSALQRLTSDELKSAHRQIQERVAEAANFGRDRHLEEDLCWVQRELQARGSTIGEKPWRPRSNSQKNVN